MVSVSPLVLPVPVSLLLESGVVVVHTVLFVHVRDDSPEQSAEFPVLQVRVCVPEPPPQVPEHALQPLQVAVPIKHDSGMSDAWHVGDPVVIQFPFEHMNEVEPVRQEASLVIVTDSPLWTVPLYEPEQPEPHETLPLYEQSCAGDTALHDELPPTQSPPEQVTEAEPVYPEAVFCTVTEAPSSTVPLYEPEQPEPQGTLPLYEQDCPIVGAQ